jgi:hypothetical protein
MTSKSKKQEAIAKLLGLELPTAKSKAEATEISREAEAVLVYSETPEAFVSKTCKGCGLLFAHTPGAVGYCSDVCRAAALAKLGIKWDWLKPPERRWGLRWPLIIGPRALAVLESLPTVEPTPKPVEVDPMNDPELLAILSEYEL